MSDNATAVFFVVAFLAAGAWSEWVGYRRSRAWAENEHRRGQDRPGADG
jgi:hypothetical protein